MMRKGIAAFKRAQCVVGIRYRDGCNPEGNIMHDLYNLQLLLFCLPVGVLVAAEKESVLWLKPKLS